MEKNIYKGEIDNFCGFEYIKAINVPMYDSKFGPVIDLDPHAMELMAAHVIIKFGVSIGGAEVHVLRSALELSLEKFARELNLSAATVLKWEKSEREPLSTPNQLAVRLFVAEKLEIPLEPIFSQLKTHAATHTLEFDVGALAS